MNTYKPETMKKGFIILLILLLTPFVKTTAQSQNLEKLNAFKIGFFTKRLNLTSREAEKFWPVYNDFQDQKTRIQFEKTMIIRNFNQNESSLSDIQLSELGDKLVATIVQESALAVSFHNKLKEVLAPAKVIRFYQVENQYKAQLLNELQGKQQQRLNPGRDL
jgi:hypothetical protein